MNRASGHPWSEGARRLGRVGGLVATAILVGIVMVVPDTQAEAADDITLTLTEQPYIVSPGDPWTASFDVVGDLGPAASATTTSASTVTPPTTEPTSEPARPIVDARVQVHRVLEDRASLDDALHGDVGATVSRFTQPVALVGTARASAFTVVVPTTNDPDVSDALVLASPGIYPVTVDLVVDGEAVASHRTFLERSTISGSDDGAPLRVAVVASIDDPGPQPAAPATTAARRDAAGIADAAAALGGTITVQIPPSVVAGLDATTLASLRTSLDGAEVLASPALALDPSSAVAAGQAEEFSRQLRDGEDLLGAALPDEPPQRSAWLVGPPLSAPAAAMLRDPLGYDLLVFDQEVYNDLEGSIGGYHDQTLATTVELDGTTAMLPGLVVHPASRWLDTRTASDDGVGSIDAAIAVMAELRVTRHELGRELRRSAVLEIPAGTPPDPAVLAALAGYVASAPNMSLSTLSDVVGTDVMEVPGRGSEAVRLPADAGIDLAERVERIALTRLNATGAGSMLRDSTRAEAWDDELDQLVSTSLDDSEVDARLVAVTAEADAVYRCVTLPDPGTFTLTGRDSILRLNINNRCDDDLLVVVHPASSKLTFPDGDVARTLAANGITEVEIDTRSRTNGTSAISVDLLTPVGSLRLPDRLVLTARVNALSGLGQVVTGGALLVLASWWYGHFRKRRRVRRAMLGEVDNPVHVDGVSPDAAEVVGATPVTSSDSVIEP